MINSRLVLKYEFIFCDNMNSLKTVLLPLGCMQVIQ